MMKTPEFKTDGLQCDSPDKIPLTREHFDALSIRVYSRSDKDSKHSLSPHRRDFYKILMVTEGQGMLTVGASTYYIEEPMIIFLHPSDIISWKGLSSGQEGYNCLFSKNLLDKHPLLKLTIEKYHLFDGQKNIIRLRYPDVAALSTIFSSMQEEEMSGNRLNEDAMQTYLQLLLIQCARITDFKEPDHISDDYRHVHTFFSLLEREVMNVHYSNPISMKTAKEFAANLNVHPNYLNTLLKKHTGQNVSTHIRTRLLEEAKSLLLQTDWTLQDIGYCIGFAEQPNFSLFFKKNAGITPAEYRRKIRN